MPKRIASLSSCALVCTMHRTMSHRAALLFTTWPLLSLAHPAHSSTPAVVPSAVSPPAVSPPAVPQHTHNLLFHHTPTTCYFTTCCLTSCCHTTHPPPAISPSAATPHTHHLVYHLLLPHHTPTTITGIYYAEDIVLTSRPIAPMLDGMCSGGGRKGSFPTNMKGRKARGDNKGPVSAKPANVADMSRPHTPTLYSGAAWIFFGPMSVNSRVHDVKVSQGESWWGP
jgi:hypothetical protein